MKCKNCNRNFRTLGIAPYCERVCYKCGFNNGSEQNDNDALSVIDEEKKEKC